MGKIEFMNIDRLKTELALKSVTAIERCKSISDDDLLKMVEEKCLGRTYLQNKSVYPRYMKYEKFWLRFFRHVVNEIKNGEKRTSRLNYKLIQNMMLTGSAYTSEAFFLNEIKTVPSYVVSPWRNALVQHHLQEGMAMKPDCIIELGSGPAFILHQLWCTDGIYDCNYLAGEITQIGQLTALLISAFEAEYKFDSFTFDFERPDLSSIYNKYNRILFITKGAIEQIRIISKVLFVELINSVQHVSCAHFEPVGWQFFEEDEMNFLTKTHMNRCKTAGYNENLKIILDGLVKENRIRIVNTDINFSGKADTYETYIYWEKVEK
jgi:hypothetical protein